VLLDPDVAQAFPDDRAVNDALSALLAAGYSAILSRRTNDSKESRMKSEPTEEGITAANIAKELGASPAKVKKAIEALKLAPVAKKGVCSFYSRDAIKKIKAAIK